MLEKSEPYNFILGARNTEKVQAAYNDLGYDTSKHSVTIIPLDLLSLRSVQLFTQQALAKLGPNRVDILYLAAGTLDSAEGPGPHGSQWCEGYVVNHLGKWGNAPLDPIPQEIAAQYVDNINSSALPRSPTP